MPKKSRKKPAKNNPKLKPQEQAVKLKPKRQVGPVVRAPVVDEQARCPKCQALFPTVALMQAHSVKCGTEIMLPNEKSQDARRKTVQELYLRGLSIAAIAKGLNTSAGTVYKDLQEIKKENLELIRTMQTQNVLVEELPKLTHMEDQIRSDYHSVPQDSPSRVMTHREWLETWKTKYEVFMRLGIFPSSPAEFAASMNRPNLIGKTLPELQKMLEDIAEKKRQLAEKMAETVKELQQIDGPENKEK